MLNFYIYLESWAVNFAEGFTEDCSQWFQWVKSSFDQKSGWLRKSLAFNFLWSKFSSITMDESTAFFLFGGCFKIRLISPKHRDLQFLAAERQQSLIGKHSPQGFRETLPNR